MNSKSNVIGKFESAKFYPSGEENKGSKPISGKKILANIAKGTVGTVSFLAAVSLAENMDSAGDFIKAMGCLAVAGNALSKDIRLLTKGLSQAAVEKATELRKRFNYALNNDKDKMGGSFLNRFREGYNGYNDDTVAFEVHGAKKEAGEGTEIIFKNKLAERSER